MMIVIMRAPPPRSPPASRGSGRTAPSGLRCYAMYVCM